MMKVKTLILAVLVTGWLVPVRASAQFVMKNRPSLRLGEFLRVDLRARVQTDFRAFSPDLTTDEGSFDLNRARLGVEGTFLEHFDYQVERELRETFGGLKPKHPWRDAYVNFGYFDNFQLKAGKFRLICVIRGHYSSAASAQVAL